MMASVAAPAAAQWLGMPVWNSPKGGTGVTISGDFGKPNDAYGAGTAWGGRASLGLGTLTLTAGVSSYQSDSIGPDRVTSYGGAADFRVIGGSLLPVAINLQAGAVRTSEVELGKGGQTYVMGAVGLSVPLPTPGINIEPYLSPGIRYRNFGTNNGSSTEFGYAIGANIGLGLLGIHLAYDNEKQKGGGSVGVFGVGAHVSLKVPLGM
ncbi:MAG TPA: hypothetical protein VEK85_04670 [Gemmatimonadales bacterium]|nr:hypothetical protein [Gemmatimonadales bacterium]